MKNESTKPIELLACKITVILNKGLPDLFALHWKISIHGMYIIPLMI